MYEKPRERNTPPSPKFTRRDFLKKMFKAAGFGLYISSKIPFGPHRELEASQLKEQADWKGGIESLLKDVFESPVETAGTFVKLQNGRNLWLNIQDGGKMEVRNNISLFIKKLKEHKIKNKQIEKIIFLHTHPISAYSKLSKNQEISNNTENIILPPSPDDLDIRFPDWPGNEHFKEQFTTHNLSDQIHKYRKGVVCPGGVWLWQKIQINKTANHEKLKHHLNQKKEIEPQWKEMIEKEIKPKIQNTSIEKLKEMLIEKAKNDFENLVKSPDNLDSGQVRFLFEIILSCNEELIKEFVDRGNLSLALNHAKLKKIDQRI